MKHSKKLLSMCLALAMMLGLLIPQAITAVADESTNLVWDSTVAGTDQYALDIPDAKNFELTYRAKFNFKKDTPDSWNGLWIKTHVTDTAEELFKIQTTYLGSETTWVGDWGFSLNAYEDQWITVSLQVIDDRASLSINNGEKYVTTTVRENAQAGKIILGASDCDFQLDDIVVKTYTNTAYSEDFTENTDGASDAYNPGTGIDYVAPVVEKDFQLTFKVNFDLYDKTEYSWEGFWVKVRQNTANNAVDLAKFGCNFIGNESNWNGPWVNTVLGWENTWKEITIQVGGQMMLIVVDGTAYAAPLTCSEAMAVTINLLTDISLRAVL